MDFTESKFNHMGFIFCGNKKHSPGSFAEKWIIKKFFLVISWFLEICFMIYKKQEITKETFLIITFLQNCLVNVFLFALKMKSMWIYLDFIHSIYWVQHYYPTATSR